jgi:hypothetical protein
MVKRYFTIESLGVKTVENCRSKEDIRARKIMEETERRVGERWDFVLYGLGFFPVFCEYCQARAPSLVPSAQTLIIMHFIAVRSKEELTNSI